MQLNSSNAGNGNGSNNSSTSLRYPIIASVFFKFYSLLCTSDLDYGTTEL